MRSINYGYLFVGSLLLGACGGGEEETRPVQPPPPPAVSVSSAATAPADTGAATPPEAPKASLADLQKKSLQTVVDALNAHDADKAVSVYTDDAVFRMAGMPDVQGKSAIKDSLSKEWAAFPDAKYAVARTWTKNDVVIVEWGFTGTNSGDFMGMKATNKPVGLMAVSVVWTTPDGLAKEEHLYEDMGSMMMQLGVKKAMGRPAVALPSASEAHVAKGTADEDKNADVARNFATTMEKKDVKAFLDGITDDSSYDMNTAPAAMSGKKAAETWFKAMTKAFPDAKSSITNVWGVEDYVIDEYTMTGTQKGALTMGKTSIPATGKQVNLHGVEILQIKDGKMAKGWGYENGAEFAMQLGLMKPPGQAPAAGAPAGKSGAAPGTAPKAPKPPTK